MSCLALAEGDAFLMAFHEPADAVRWALATQQVRQACQGDVAANRQVPHVPLRRNGTSGVQWQQDKQPWYCVRDSAGASDSQMARSTAVS